MPHIASRVFMRIKMPTVKARTFGLHVSWGGGVWPYLQVSRGRSFRQGDLYNLPSRYVQPSAHPAISGACQKHGRTLLPLHNPISIQHLHRPFIFPVHALLTQLLQTLPNASIPISLKVHGKGWRWPSGSDQVPEVS